MLLLQTSLVAFGPLSQKASWLLYRLAPGRSGTIGAVRCAGGALVTDTGNMAKVLRQHWADIFKARWVDEDLLRAWINDDLDGRCYDHSLQNDMATARLDRKFFYGCSSVLQ